MQKVAGKMGIQIANPKVVSIPDDRTDSYVKQLRNLVDPSVQMVMTLVPQQKSDRYGEDRLLKYFQVHLAQYFQGELFHSSCYQEIVLH